MRSAGKREVLRLLEYALAQTVRVGERRERVGDPWIPFHLVACAIVDRLDSEVDVIAFDDVDRTHIRGRGGAAGRRKRGIPQLRRILLDSDRDTITLVGRRRNRIAGQRRVQRDWRVDRDGAVERGYPTRNRVLER